MDEIGRPVAWACIFSLTASLAWGALATAPVTAEDAANAAAVDELAEIVVETTEPRFVAPTRRDQIGRIWAPVMINGRGPFRLVLDTGASHSAITARVARALGIDTDRSPPVILRGVTGTAVVPTALVDNLSVGDVSVDSPVLPIIPDALGGAQGMLGSEGLANKRIFIDFRHDRIIIKYSRNERSERDSVVVPFKSLRGQLIVVDTRVGTVRAKAIIDTGGQTTIANLALHAALMRRAAAQGGKPDQIIGATLDVQDGILTAMPPIDFGSGLRIADSAVTFADMYIFKQWKLLNEPAILIGMDALGLLDTLVIDYRRHELHLRTRAPGGSTT